MKTKLTQNNKSNTLKLSLYFTICMALYTGFGFLLYMIISLLYHSFSFERYDMLYILANIYGSLEPVIFIAYIITGFFFMSYIFLKKPFSYMQELAYATKRLYENETPLSLSPALKEYEADISNIRLKLLQNERAAKEAEQRKNDLVVYLAHDLKTPLTSVIGYLSLLKDERKISDSLREKYINISLNKAEHLEELINEFFEITRFNLTTLTLEASRINLSLMLNQLTYEFKPILDEKGLQCTLSAPQSLYYDCDAVKLSRAFDNLLRNAANYSFPDSVIEITLTERQSQIEIIFKNKGYTIPPEKLSRIFEQFYRLDSSRTTAKGGAGLGLAIAKEIIELHRGNITAESFDNNIIFLITLPKD